MDGKIDVKAVPAFNVAGDTDKHSGMEELKGVDIAFHTILSPYCLNARACKSALEIIKPRIFLPILLDESLQREAREH